MKKYIIIGLILSLIVLSGCERVEVTKYVCQDNSIVNDLSNCPTVETHIPKITEEKKPDLVIKGVTQRINEYGWLYITGEVYNQGNIDISSLDVRVRATFYDSSSNVVETDSDLISESIPIGQSRSFKISLRGEEVISMIDSYKLRLDCDDYPELESEEFVGKVDTTPPAKEPEPQAELEIRGTTSEIKYGWLIISGEIYNKGDVMVEYVRIAATLYDADGNVIGSETTYARPDGKIPIGESRSFKITVLDSELSSKVKDYKLNVI